MKRGREGERGGVRGEVERGGKEKREEVRMETGKGRGEKGRREGEYTPVHRFPPFFLYSNLHPALATEILMSTPRVGLPTPLNLSGNTFIDAPFCPGFLTQF